MATSDKIVCLITGANRGIGLETARILLRSRGPGGRPYHVLLGSRSLAKGEAAVAELQQQTAAAAGEGGGDDASTAVLGTVSAVELDITSTESAAAAAAHVAERFGRLDALVNNVGILNGEVAEGAGVVAELRSLLETNVVGPAVVTEAFLPLLQKQQSAAGDGAARLIFLTTSLGSLTLSADPAAPAYRTLTATSQSEYRVAKVGVNMLMLEYHKHWCVDDALAVAGAERRQGKRPIRVWAVDPGPTTTLFAGPALREMGIKMGISGPEVNAKLVTACLQGERDGLEGKVLSARGVSPW